MDPGLVAEFVAAFSAEWHRLVAEHGAGDMASRRELQAVEKKIANLVDAISEGIRSADLKSRLGELEQRRAALIADLSRVKYPLPPLNFDLARVYREKVARLADALQSPDAIEAREAARALIDQIIITPPDDDGGPPGIEVIGDFIAMLQAGGMSHSNRENRAQDTELLRTLTSSVKAGPGAYSVGCTVRVSLLLKERPSNGFQGRYALGGGPGGSAPWLC